MRLRLLFKYSFTPLVVVIAILLGTWFLGYAA